MIDLVVKIAREKLGCDFDYEAASKFLKECFAELDDSAIDDILFGRKTAIETESGGELIDKSDDSVLNYVELYTIKLNEIERYLLDDKDIYHLKCNVDGCSVKFEDILNYYEERIDPFIDSDVVYAWRNAISSYMDNFKILHLMIKSLSHFNEPELLDRATYLYQKVEEGLTKLKSNAIELRNDSVSEYLSYESKLNKIETISPTENYHDAGYIAPNGDYYGLDGKVANFLHLRIADFLVKQEHIPYDGKSPDYYVEKAGYIKQHDNKITAFKVFDEAFLTQKQLDTIINIVSQKWKEVTFDFGDGDWTISIDKVKQLNNDELEFQYKAICR